MLEVFAILAILFILTWILVRYNANEHLRMEKQYTTDELKHVEQLRKEIKQLRKEKAKQENVIREADAKYDSAQDEFTDAENEMRSNHIYRQTPRYVKASKQLSDALKHSDAERATLEQIELKLRDKKIALSNIVDVTFE